MKTFEFEIWCKDKYLNDENYQKWVDDGLDITGNFDAHLKILNFIIKEFKNTTANYIAIQIDLLEDYLLLLEVVDMITDGQYKVRSGGQIIEMFV